MSDDIINIEVDGVPMQARKGQMIIEVTDSNDVFVPRFCYHPKLSIAANCRMCLVEVERTPKPLPACATPVADGMKVYTRSRRAVSAQKATMEFLLINHPLDCPICDQGGECELQDISMGYGSDVSRFTERKRIVKDKDIGPLVSTDMTRCIHCTRCVRFGLEIAGLQELGTTGRTEDMKIGTWIERSVDHELSGNIIDVCPVGALNNKPFRYRARAWEMLQQELISPHDCVGSHLYVHTLRGRVMRNVPRQYEAINETWLADRDRYGCHGIYSEDRLERPLLRDEGGWREATWGEAITRAAEGLRDVAQRCGPGELGYLASPGATLEEHYLLARIARALGSHNVDHRLRRQDFTDQELDPVVPGLGVTLEEVERLRGLLVVGSALRREVPMLAHRVRKAALGGTTVAFLNPAPMEWWFPVAAEVAAPVADQARALALILAADCDGDFAGLPGELSAVLAGLAPEDVHRRAAAVLRGDGLRALWLGLLAQRHPGFADLRVLAAALCGRTGATLGYLGEGANSAGASLAGALPHRDAGGAAVANPGRDAASMLAAPPAGCVLLGLEPDADTMAGADCVEALAGADFVLAVSPWDTPALRRCAHVLLPAGTAYETPGTFVNCEGRWQSFAGAARPVADARPAWKILRVLGNTLGLEGFGYQSSEEVRDELRGRCASVDAKAPDIRPRTVSLAHEGVIVEGTMYSGDGLVRRSRPLQETREGRSPPRVWT